MERAWTRKFTKGNGNLPCEFHATTKNNYLTHEKSRSNYSFFKI